VVGSLVRHVVVIIIIDDGVGAATPAAIVTRGDGSTGPSESPV